MIFFLLGVILTLCIYHLIIYLGRKHDLNMLAFALLCFVISLTIFYEDILPQFIKLGELWIFITDVVSPILYLIAINFFALTIVKLKNQKIPIKISVVCNAILILIGIMCINYYLFFKNKILPLLILQISFGTYAGIFSVVGVIIIIKQKAYKETRFIISSISMLILMLGACLYLVFKSYNILGEELTTLVSERLTAGKYNYELDASGLASGVYLYRIQAGDYMEVKKMMLMK